MRVLNIVPGSGAGFYCENCMRDSALTQALRQQGVDVTMLPIYLPVVGDAATLNDSVPVFFGGINVYLQQQFPLFRKTPRWLDRIFDSRLMLRLASRMSRSTRADGLGAMTLSMIRVEEGNQRKELKRLLAWVATQPKPDVIHITTVMLAGLARPLKAALGVPVVCSAMDEEVWIDALDGEFPARCWEAMRERARDADAIIAVSDWYRGIMHERLRAPEGQIQTVHIGVDPSGISLAPLRLAPPTIGYLSRQCHHLGLGMLFDAYLALRQHPGLEALRLEAFGGMAGSDRRFVGQLQARARKAGCTPDQVVFHTSMARTDKLTFLQNIDIMCVPMEGGEAFGTFIAESWMAGVPVVVPRAAAFPELISCAGGGVLYDKHSVDHVTAALQQLLESPKHVRELGRAGHAYAREHFTVEAMAERTIRIYERVVAANHGDNQA